MVLDFSFQVILVIGCILTYMYIIRTIRKSNVRIDDIIIWVIGILILFVFSVFPIIPAKLATLFNFISPANFIFFSVIFFLFVMVFLLTIKVSQQQEKVKDLTHKLAMFEKELNKKRVNRQDN